MTRIIGGIAGGRQIAAPKGTGTRPTTDRVRESLFARLESIGAVAGSRVADLFCGSGALGLEAVSRGAASAVLVESDPAAAAVARRNVERLGLRGVTVVADRVERFLGHAIGRDEGYDLVLLDPPYALSDEVTSDLLVAVAAVLTPGGVVSVERSSRSPAPLWPPSVTAVGGRTYGETAVWLAELTSGLPSPLLGAGVGAADEVPLEGEEDDGHRDGHQ